MLLIPSRIQVDKNAAELVLHFTDIEPDIRLGFEYLRVYSPSAEVRGHGQGPLNFPPAKMRVKIDKASLVGNYGLQLFFDDGHDTGIYRWDYLILLDTEYTERWQAYVRQLQRLGLSREPGVQVLKGL